MTHKPIVRSPLKLATDIPYENKAANGCVANHDLVVYNEYNMIMITT